LNENGKKNEETTKKLESISKQLESLTTEKSSSNDILSKLLVFNPQNKQQ